MEERKDVRARIEDRFYDWGGWAYDHARLLLFAGVIIFFSFFNQLVSPKLEISAGPFLHENDPALIKYREFINPFSDDGKVYLSLWRNIEIDTTTEGFLHPDDPDVLAYNRFREIFGRDDLLIIALDAGNVFDSEFLASLDLIHERLELEIPYVRDVKSLINARNVYGVEDELVVEDLIEVLPKTPEELALLEGKARSNKLYINNFFSADNTLANLVVRFNGYYLNEASGNFEKITEEHMFQSLAVLEKILEEEKHRFKGSYISGVPQMTFALQNAMYHDMGVFTGSVLLIIFVLLFLIFRRMSGVLMPALIVVLSLVSTMAMLAIFDQPIQMPITIIPSFILAVGVGNSVHLLTHFYRFYDDSGDKRLSLQKAMRHTGLAMLLTSLTTAAGLGSFSGAEILPVANLGIFSACGVMLAFLYTIVFIPSLLGIVGVKQQSEAGEKQAMHHSWFIGFTDLCASVAINHAGKVVAISVIIFASLVYQALQLPFSHNPMKWFKEGETIRQATEIIDSRLGGTVSVEFLVETVEPGGVKDSALMLAIDQFAARAEAYEGKLSVGRVIAPSDIVKETNRALHGNSPGEYRIPDQSDLVAQELFLFEISDGDQLRLMIDTEYQIARLTLVTPWVDSVYYEEFLGDILATGREVFEPLEVSFTATGILPLMTGTLNSVMYSTVNSYLIAFCVITIMMVLLLKGFKYGLVSMFPNLIPIVIVLGLLKSMGGSLDMFTMLVGSIAIGLAVDDTVHFMHSFQKLYEKSGDARYAIRETLHTTGKAMLVTSIVLSSGFYIYLLSDLNNLFFFGILTGSCILLALVADFLLAPALMVIMHPDSEEA